MKPIERQKLIILGADKVGKTSIISRYLFHKHKDIGEEALFKIEKQKQKSCMIYKRIVEASGKFIDYELWDMPNERDLFV